MAIQKASFVRSRWLKRLPKLAKARAFSLVEVALALGLISYVLVSLLGLFVVGLTSSRESSVDTAFAQIALDVSSRYAGTAVVDPNNPPTYQYSYDGQAKSPSDPASEKYFTVTVQDKPSTISNTSSNLHLLTLSITRAVNPTVIIGVIQTSVFVP